jgi:hypothetical protein
MNENYIWKKEMSMSKQKTKKSHRTGNSGRIVKARYDENSKFAAFDVVEISHDGKQSKVLSRGMLEGVDPKQLTIILIHVTETFACSQGELEIIGNEAGTSTQYETDKHHHA